MYASSSAWHIEMVQPRPLRERCIWSGRRREAVLEEPSALMCRYVEGGRLEAPAVVRPVPTWPATTDLDIVPRLKPCEAAYGQQMLSQLIDAGLVEGLL